MKQPYSLLALYIPTRDLGGWVKIFAHLFTGEVQTGIYVRGWSGLHLWLQTLDSSQSLSPQAMHDIEMQSEEIELKAGISSLSQPQLNRLYRLTSVSTLEAFLWSSLQYDELPLAMLPGSCDNNDKSKIILAIDHLSMSQYCEIASSARWFATVNAENADQPIACVVTKDAILKRSIRDAFATLLLSDNDVHQYG